MKRSNTIAIINLHENQRSPKNISTFFHHSRG
jgi:hypothetical protein